MNTLYLWNGHPFASLVKLDDYPYALEVSEEVYQRNVEMYRLLTQEADNAASGSFRCSTTSLYQSRLPNINHIETQHAAPTPLIADYTRKSITNSWKCTPIGLLVCLGEALKGRRIRKPDE